MSAQNIILNFDQESVQSVQNFLQFLKSYYNINDAGELADFMRDNGINGKRIINKIKQKYNLYNFSELWKFKKEFKEKYTSTYIKMAEDIGYNKIDELKQHLPYFFDNFVYDLILPYIDCADAGWANMNYDPIYQKEEFAWN